MYTFMGLFPVLRRELHKESKRVGFDSKQKKDFIEQMLRKKVPITHMTITQLETVINELRKIES